jgi:hypothetical protein
MLMHNAHSVTPPVIFGWQNVEDFVQTIRAAMRFAITSSSACASWRSESTELQVSCA